MNTIPPAALPIEKCAWCWPTLHPAQQYPAEWSSTICHEHAEWMMSRHAEDRVRRVRSLDMQEGMSDAGEKTSRTLLVHRVGECDEQYNDGVFRCECGSGQECFC